MFTSSSQPKTAFSGTASCVFLKTTGRGINYDGTVKYDQVVTGTFPHPQRDEFLDLLNETEMGWTGDHKHEINKEDLCIKPLAPVCSNETEFELYYDTMYQLALKAGFFPKVVMTTVKAVADRKDFPKAWHAKELVVVDSEDSYDGLFSDSDSDDDFQLPRAPHESDLSESESEDESDDESRAPRVKIFTDSDTESEDSGDDSDDESDDQDIEDDDLPPGVTCVVAGPVPTFHMHDDMQPQTDFGSENGLWDEVAVPRKSRKRKRVQVAVRWSKRLAKRARRAPVYFADFA